MNILKKNGKVTRVKILTELREFSFSPNLYLCKNTASIYDTVTLYVGYKRVSNTHHITDDDFLFRCAYLLT